MIVGAPGVDAPALESGAAYVYGLHSGSWVVESKLVPPAASTGTASGRAVVVSDDYAFVTATGGPTYGRVDIWRRTGDYPFVTWEHRTTILNPDSSFSGFGMAVAFQDPILAVGAPISSGRVAIFTRSLPGSDVWALQSTIAPLDFEGGDEFGAGLSLCTAGLWVGAPGKLYAGSRVGAAYLFGTQGDGTWLQLQKALPFDLPANARFGASLATFTNGPERVVIGAPGRNGAYVLPSSPPPAVYCQAKLNSQSCLPAIAFSGTPSLSDPVGFTVSAANILSNTSGILFWGLLQNNVPFGGGTLCVLPPLRRTPIQNAGGNPPPNDCSGSFTYQFTASYLASNFQIGASVFAQFYSRDNGFAIPNNVGLTDAVRFTVLP